MFRHLLLLLVSLSLTACSTITGQSAFRYDASPTLDKASYLQSDSNAGVVLVDVNWSRYWGCGDYENAQLFYLGFHKLPVASNTAPSTPDLVLNNPAQLLAKNRFESYAYLVSPGTYALTDISLKLARSVNIIRHFVTDKSKLIKDDEPLAGTFTVKPGEVVYIGNFYLDCTIDPMPWRYYTKAEHFDEGLEGYRAKYPFLKLDDVQYRLFETDMLGHDYAPPKQDKLKQAEGTKK